TSGSSTASPARSWLLSAGGGGCTRTEHGQSLAAGTPAWLVCSVVACLARLVRKRHFRFQWGSLNVALFFRCSTGTTTGTEAWGQNHMLGPRSTEENIGWDKREHHGFLLIVWDATLQTPSSLITSTASVSTAPLSNALRNSKPR